MSDHALNRAVTYRSLKDGEQVPNDGRVYREASGRLVIGLRYPPSLKLRHDMLLARIAAFDKRTAK